MAGIITFAGSTSDRAKLAEEVIQTVFSEMDVSLAPRVEVNFVESGGSRGQYAFVTGGSSTNITFNLHNFNFADANDFSAQIRSTFIHEYHHLMHHVASDYYHRSQAKLDRMMLSIIEQPTLTEVHAVERYFGYIRFSILVFREQILDEGIAKYAQYYLDPNAVSKSPEVLNEEFIREYIAMENYYQEEITSLRNALNALNTTNETIADQAYAIIRDFFALAPYLLGKHMVSAVLRYNQTITVNQLLELSPDAFIMLYEETMRTKGIRPLFSLGPAGRLSYNEFLRLFIESYQSFVHAHAKMK